MNEQTVHPIVRYGGPILGAVILYFVLSSMIGNFQTDLEEARRAPVVAEVGSGEGGTEAAVENEASASEAATAEEVTNDGEAAAEAEATGDVEISAEEATTPSAVATESEGEAEPATVVDTPAAENVAPADTGTDEASAAEPQESVAEPQEPVVETPATEAPAPAELNQPSIVEVATVELGTEGESPTTAETPTPALAQPQAAAPTVVAAEPEVTVPTTLAEMTPEQIYAGLPDEIAAFFPDSADAGTGEELALISGCTACHSLQEGVVQVGPSWYNVAEHALTRVEGQSPALYLYTSITQPNAYLVEGFQPNLMPLIYKDTLSDEQLANIIAYLLTLRGNE